MEILERFGDKLPEKQLIDNLKIKSLLIWIVQLNSGKFLI